MRTKLRAIASILTKVKCRDSEVTILMTLRDILFVCYGVYEPSVCYRFDLDEIL